MSSWKGSVANGSPCGRRQLQVHPGSSRAISLTRRRRRITLTIGLTAYTNVLYNLRLTEQEAAANGQKNLEGAAKILEGIQMGTVTALWGDVPYSQAARAQRDDDT